MNCECCGDLISYTGTCLACTGTVSCALCNSWISCSCGRGQNTPHQCPNVTIVDSGTIVVDSKPDHNFTVARIAKGGVSS